MLFDIPIDIQYGEQVVSGILQADLKLGKPRPPRGIDEEILLLTLQYNDQNFKSSGTVGFFEDEMLDIQKQLPNDTYMLCCFSCAFSDYHPVGNGLFGSMMCFRDNKEAYLSVKSKSDFLEIDRTMSGLVQETYICNEFEKRIPGTGYRG